MNLFLAPHNDDEGLFGCYIILHNKPIIVAVVTDSCIHQQRFGIPIEVRRKGSQCACNIMDVPVEFWGMADDGVTYNKLVNLFRAHKRNYDKVFAPAIEGGNKTHDLVSEASWTIWKNKCVFYSTYSKERLFPVGDTPIVPLRYEIRKKKRVLNCYKSQHGINKPHFDAVIGKLEYYE